MRVLKLADRYEGQVRRTSCPDYLRLLDEVSAIAAWLFGRQRYLTRKKENPALGGALRLATWGIWGLVAASTKL